MFLNKIFTDVLFFQSTFFDLQLTNLLELSIWEIYSLIN